MFSGYDEMSKNSKMVVSNILPKWKFLEVVA
jgi:hypothetical protein